MSFLPDEIEFEITQEDIDKGMAGSFLNCPAALALKRLYPSYVVKVGQTYTWVHDKKYANNDVLGNFIDNFDRSFPRNAKPTRCKLFTYRP